MEKKRQRFLSNGWYPKTKKEVLSEINSWELQEGKETSKPALAALIPHAGWYFSGKLAAQTLKQTTVNNEPDLIVVLGGHLAPGNTNLIYLEKYWETPLGDLEINLDFGKQLQETLFLQEVLGATNDNTVEVTLPLIKFFYPQQKILPLRIAPDSSAKIVAQKLFALSQKYKKNFLLVASSDLTHYGPNYGFSPYGEGEKAYLESVAKDSEFLKLVSALETEKLLKYALMYHTACSAGAIATITEYAKLHATENSILIEQCTSLEKSGNTENWVGYGGMVFY